MRDICKCTGVTLDFSGDNQYILENDGEKMRELIVAQIQKLRMKDTSLSNKKRKVVQLPEISDEELFTYQNLPFQPRDIYDFHPILKNLNIQNKDAIQFMHEARTAQAEGQLEKAFDGYSQTINVLL